MVAEMHLNAALTWALLALGVAIIAFGGMLL